MCCYLLIVLSTFLSSPLCLEQIDHDVTELLGLVPAYIYSERLRLNRKQREQTNSDGRRTRRLQQSVDTGNAKLTQMVKLLRKSLEQLTLNKLDLSVPGEEPTEISSGDVLRLTKLTEDWFPPDLPVVTGGSNTGDKHVITYCVFYAYLLVVLFFQN